jgi:propionyl-CoA synthetase
MIITAEAGMRAGKVVPYKPLLDEAIQISSYKPEHVLIVSRGLCAYETIADRDLDYAQERQKHLDSLVECEWLEATDPSYILYTSGTTGKPKGVQRDTGGYAVALATSMDYIFCAKPGQTMFCTSDIGWVVGHGYIIYGPLIHGMATIMFEGTPLKPDAGIWWHLVEKYRVSTMFSSPTAIRVLKKQDPKFIEERDLSSLESFFLAGEPLDEPTAKWISQAIEKPIIDNYWQTETGWPILSLQRGIEAMPNKFGSPGVPVFGYNMKLLDDVTGDELPPHQKGLLAIEGPLPPGCMQTVWGDDKRFVSTYWQGFAGRLVYSTFDWGIKDEDGYFFILGRTDDVINTAGHRLGTREIEESISSHPNVAEVAVVGIADELKGQVAIAFAIPKNNQHIVNLEKELMTVVDQQLGPVARPARIYIVEALPKTRSGKIVRRALQAITEHRDPGDISTMEDKNVLSQIQVVIAQQ